MRYGVTKSAPSAVRFRFFRRKWFKTPKVLVALQEKQKEAEKHHMYALRASRSEAAPGGFGGVSPPTFSARRRRKFFFEVASLNREKFEERRSVDASRDFTTPSNRSIESQRAVIG